MLVKVNCIYNDCGAWCTNKNIYRSLYGFGARVCPVHNGNMCKLQIKKQLSSIKPTSLKT